MTLTVNTVTTMTTLPPGPQPRFGAHLPKPGSLTKLAEGYLAADHHLTSWVVRGKKSSNPLTKAISWTFGHVMQKLAKNDFTDFTKYGPITIATPSQGSLMWMMYIGLLGARAQRAYERGIMPNGKRDYREMFDVFRRDMWGITLYIFGLFAFNNWLSKLRQPKAGINLANEAGVIPFSSHDINARLSNARVLAAHIKKGHAKGILQAANHNGYLGVPKDLAQHDPQAAKALEQLILKFRKTLAPLEKLSLKTLGAPRSKTRIEQIAKTAQPLLNEMDALQKRTIQQLSKNPALASSKWLKGWGSYKNFFAHYAKNQRAPLDLYSCIAMLILLGYGPVWFNQWWTERQYNKRLAELKTQAQQHLQQSQPRHASPSPAIGNPKPTSLSFSLPQSRPQFPPQALPQPLPQYLGATSPFSQTPYPGTFPPPNAVTFPLPPVLAHQYIRNV
ncbi:MAG: hypothetical protein KC476_01930 [Cyanobacteria bacterium HKST-UBA06]|nr:hypothetical protein [Cyanobacteria bacterium HKST-UBA06]